MIYYDYVPFDIEQDILAWGLFAEKLNTLSIISESTGPDRRGTQGTPQQTVENGEGDGGSFRAKG